MIKITAKTKICMIIGDPIETSLSPKMHNACYAKENIDDRFVFLAARVEEKNLKDAILGAKAMGIRGITVTHPHKLAVIKLLDKVEEAAKKIGAVNTIVNDNGKLIGSNTDYIGVYKALEEYTTLKGKKVAIIGAGGAGRAAVFAIVSRGADVTIFNRTVDRAKLLAEEFNCNFEEMEKAQKIKDMDIIINVTTVSMDKDKSPIDKNIIQKNHIVFDAVYSPFETKLLRDAKEKGATIIHGTEWLLHQGVAQYEVYTGKKASVETMKNAILESVKLNI